MPLPRTVGPSVSQQTRVFYLTRAVDRTIRHEWWLHEDGLKRPPYHPTSLSQLPHTDSIRFSDDRACRPLLRSVIHSSSQEAPTRYSNTQPTFTPADV